MWYSETLGVIKTPRELTINSITYPRQIFRKWGKPELAELGIRPARVVTPDSRYYNTGGENYELIAGEWVISYVETEKDVEVLKEQRVSTIKSQVGSTLSKSDWMIIREQEGYKTSPDGWKEWRAATRDYGNFLEAEIEDITSLEELKVWDKAEKFWPNDPDYVEPVEDE